MAVCVCGGTGCPGQWQHLLGKFPFYAVEQWGKLETGCSAEPHICLARRYRLSSANRRFSTLGAPGEASARGQAPGLLEQGKAKDTPPRTAYPPPDSARGEIRGWHVRALLRGKQEEKKTFVLAQINFSRTNTQPVPDLSGFGAVPQHTTHSRRARGKTLPPVRAQKGTGIESGWDRGGPSSLCGQPDPSSLPWT